MELNHGGVKGEELLGPEGSVRLKITIEVRADNEVYFDLTFVNQKPNHLAGGVGGPTHYGFSNSVFTDARAQVERKLREYCTCRGRGIGDIHATRSDSSCANSPMPSPYL